MFKQFLIVMLYLFYSIMWIHHKLMWPWEKITYLLYDALLYVRIRDAQDMKWALDVIAELKESLKNKDA